MMDALSLLVKAAPDAVSSKGGKTGKGDDASGKEGFSHELNGLKGDQGGGKGSARGAETRNADNEAETPTVVAEAPVEENTATGLRSFAALKAELQNAVDQTLEKASLKPAEGKTTASDLESEIFVADKTEKLEKIVKTKAKDADFSAIGRDAKVDTVPVDAKLLASALKKLQSAEKAEAAARADSKKAQDETDTAADVAVDAADAQVVQDMPAASLNDVLGLLATTSVSQQADSKAVGVKDRDITVKNVDGKSKADAAVSDEMQSGDGEALQVDGQQDRLFRLTRGEGRGQSVDLKIGNDTNGRLDVEALNPTGGQAETVNVVEARRYLGFNAPSNSSTLTAALAGNDEWVSAMHPSARLANEAQQSSTGQVVNTLKLELNPHSLGSVTAMLRLSGDNLNVHLTVHTAVAYRELREDSSAMLDALRSQGFSVDQVTVSMAPVAASSQDGGDASSRFSQQQQQQQQNMQQAAGEGSRNGDQGARQNAQGGSDSQPGIAAGRIDESEQISAVGRGAGGARPDHVYI